MCDDIPTLKKPMYYWQTLNQISHVLARNLIYYSLVIYCRIMHDPNDMSKKESIILSDGHSGQRNPDNPQKGVPARFTVDSTVTLIYGPPGRGKSYLLKQMYRNPPFALPAGPIPGERPSAKTMKGKKARTAVQAVDSI